MNKTQNIILGIETSCDETAAAVVAGGTEILSSVVASQEHLHEKYGGVVPEIACRAHIEAIQPVVEEALQRADISFQDISAIAVTHRPGLIGALLIGVTAAKTLSWMHQLPLIAVDHLRGHMYAGKLHNPELEYPFICLVVSGGHTSLFHCESVLQSRLVGRTIDDAAGEAFDKVSIMLGLGYPGGPVIDRLAVKGNPAAVAFPRTYMKKDSLNFSFSGLKTAVLYHIGGQNTKNLNEIRMSDKEKADIAASFQEAVVDVLVKKTMRAAEQFGVDRIAIGGGVACNSRLRTKMNDVAAKRAMTVYWSDLALCRDNAAMIAGLAYHKLKANQLADLALEPVAMATD